MKLITIFKWWLRGNYRKLQLFENDVESQTIFGMNQLVSGEKLVQRTFQTARRNDWLLRKSTYYDGIFIEEYWGVLELLFRNYWKMLQHFGILRIS